MWKSVLAGTTALALAGSALAYAQQGPGGPGGPRGDNARPRINAEDIVAFGDARIAGLKAGLKLTAEQEKLWPPLEKALRDGAKRRADAFAARASADQPKDPVERMQLRAQRMSEMGAALKSIADAAAPLYKTLDEGQKRRFTLLSRLEGNRFQNHWRHHERRGGPDRERGPRGPEQGPRPL
jgi:zinc resistance-associated protein